MIFAVIFIFWLFSSAVKPIYNLFKEPSNFELIYGLSSLVVLIVFSSKIMPKLTKNESLGGMEFRVGNTKEPSGCSSCKKKTKK